MNNNLYKCLIVDDEPIARRIIKNYLGKQADFVIQGEAGSAMEAFKVLAKAPVDLLFLDIQMPEVNGLDFLRTLANPPKVILVTAFREYAFEGFELDVVDYLLKPVPESRFLLALDKFRKMKPLQASQLQDFKQHYLFIRADRKHHKIDFQDIQYLESQGDYVEIFGSAQHWRTKATLGTLAEQLPPHFLKIHRSFIVNMEQLTAFNRELVEVGGKTLPVSKRFREEVITFFEGQNS
ncbi:LytTR family DNA-binding domain-containing protein [Persicobacter sp. CCB-QB2]|uniref:LytR/AlgR family response regulator transcription factor n=1 Tax=Persicobacter sp. CCB-QB2 TaxID=1561025 RepID=UPI0006A9E33E|nr:LytTR family DNA-binding domain-containing protein [Persicobacter sp. CCB-QB2]